MKNNNLNINNWHGRLDVLFDKANEKSVDLNENEIGDYADFNKSYLNEIEDFILELKRQRKIFICNPDQLLMFEMYQGYFDIKNFRPIEIVSVEIENIYFDKIIINQWCQNAPKKIYDQYILKLNCEDDMLKFSEYELSGTEIMKLKYKGSVADFSGDIIGVSYEKVLEHLNNYYSY